MQLYRKTEELARKFDAAYPEELAARVRWWCETLGLDRVRLLRLIGMSPRQAALSKSKDLQEILQNPEWKENAWRVEGMLHKLLSLFHYDWHALAAHIQSPGTRTEGEGPSRITRQEGEVDRLGNTPDGSAADLLIERMAQGGPDALSALVEYLVAAQADSGRLES
jgi:hypothetical protein